MNTETITVFAANNFCDTEVFEEFIYDFCNYNDSSPLLLHPEGILDQLFEIFTDQLDIHDTAEVSILDLPQKLQKMEYLPVIEQLLDLNDKNIYITV
jgi:hypothetical protein